MLHPKIAERIFNTKIQRASKEFKDVAGVIMDALSLPVFQSIKSFPIIKELMLALCKLNPAWLACLDVSFTITYNEDKNGFEYAIAFTYLKSIIEENAKDFIFFEVKGETQSAKTLIQSFSSLEKLKEFNDSFYFQKEDSDATLIYPCMFYLSEILPLTDAKIKGAFLEGNIREFTLQMAEERHNVRFEIGEIIEVSKYFDDLGEELNYSNK